MDAEKQKNWTVEKDSEKGTENSGEIDFRFLPPMWAHLAAEFGRPRHLTGEKRKRRIRINKALNKRKAREKVLKARIAADLKRPTWRRYNLQARVLQAAADWVTMPEIRKATGIKRGSVWWIIDKLWRSGELLKKKNPEAVENRLGALGRPACAYLWRASAAERQEHDKHDGKQGVKEIRDKG